MPSTPVYFGESDPTFAEQILNNEEKIIWIDDRMKYPYLREMEGMYLKRKEFDYGFGKLKLIGYGVAIKPVIDLPEKKLFRRRSWWIHPDDPFPEDDFPPEAVMPQFIKTGKFSPIGRM